MLDKSSWILTSEMPPQAKKTYAVEVLEKVIEVPRNILWILIVFGVIFFFFD